MGLPAMLTRTIRIAAATGSVPCKQARTQIMPFRSRLRIECVTIGTHCIGGCYMQTLDQWHLQRDIGCQPTEACFQESRVYVQRLAPLPSLPHHVSPPIPRCKRWSWAVTRQAYTLGLITRNETPQCSQGGLLHSRRQFAPCTQPVNRICRHSTAAILPCTLRICRKVRQRSRAHQFTEICLIRADGK